jgi:hypothetical protein
MPHSSANPEVGLVTGSLEQATRVVTSWSWQSFGNFKEGQRSRSASHGDASLGVANSDCESPVGVRTMEVQPSRAERLSIWENRLRFA